MKIKTSVIGLVIGLLAAPTFANGVPPLLAKPQPPAKPVVIKAAPKAPKADKYVVPLETFGNIIGQRLKDNPQVVNDMVMYVKAYQYRCDSISEARFSGNKFTLKCNKFRYTYDLIDRGGRFVVRYVE